MTSDTSTRLPLAERALAQRVREVAPSGIRRFFDILATMDDVISLGVGEPDFDTPAQIVDAGVTSLKAGRTHYTSNYGTIELRRALAEHLERRYGVAYDAATEILITVGASEAVDIALIADRHDLLVYSDEIYDRLAYGSYRHRAMSSLPGMRERTILMGGFSKAYAMTGWRVGWMCAPREILEGIVKVHQYGIMSAPTVAQDAALAAIEGGESAVVAMVAEYDRRRRLLVDGLRACGLDTFEPRGAFYAFPRITSTGLTSEAFTERLLLEERVAVVPGSAFGPSGEGHGRMCYATAYEQLEEALRRIARFVERRRA